MTKTVDLEDKIARVIGDRQKAYQVLIVCREAGLVFEKDKSLNPELDKMMLGLVTEEIEL